MHSHYLHKTLGQSYYPTAEDFDYHVRQSIEMFNNCSRRQGLRAGNPEGTTQRHWQYWVHKTQDEDKTNDKNKTKQTKSQHIYKNK
jgi:hypothetical protein